jgi:hypothetical protein
LIINKGDIVYVDVRIYYYSLLHLNIAGNSTVKLPNSSSKSFVMKMIYGDYIEKDNQNINLVDSLCHVSYSVPYLWIASFGINR